MDSSPVRWTLEAAVRARPGVDSSTLARSAGVNPSTADYHLRRLVRAGRVHRVRVGRVVAHYAAGSGHCPLLRRAIPLVANASAMRDAVEAMKAAGEHGVRPSQAARDKGVRISAMRYALVAAEQAGLAERAGFGRYRLAVAAEACAERAVERGVCAARGTCGR